MNILVRNSLSLVDTYMFVMAVVQLLRVRLKSNTINLKLQIQSIENC
ncbi:hypothetical protein [Clostridium sp. SGI.024]